MNHTHAVWQGSTALERLRRLAGATVSSKSKDGTVAMSLTGPKLSVKLHPEKIVRMPPNALAEEVISAFTGLLRGRQAAETKILSGRQDSGSDLTLPRDRLQAEVNRIEVTETADSGRVSVTWRGADSPELTITRIATRPSDRAWLEADIAQALERVNRAYRDRLRELFRRLGREATT